MSLEHSKQTPVIISNIHRAFKVHLSIYDQAILKRIKVTTPLSSSSVGDSNEITIIFYLKGELEGKIVCTMDLNNIKSKTKISYLQSLFVESMNILLGDFLTNLESETGLMSLLTPPQLVNNDVIMKNFIKSLIDVKTKYELITINELHNCIVHVLANKKNISEV